MMRFVNVRPRRPIITARLLFVFILLFIGLVLMSCGGGSNPKMLFLIGLGTPDIATFRVSGAGALTDQNLVGTGATPTAIAVDPERKFAFVASSAGSVNPGGVSQYTVNSGGLSVNQITINTSSGTSTTNTAPIASGVNPVAMVIDAGGRFAFVANQVSNTISVYTIDRSTGVLAEVKGTDASHSSPFATLPGPSGLAVSGSTLFVANQGAAKVSVFTFDGNGALTLSGTPVSAGVSPTALAVDPSGKFLYVADSASNAVLGFSVGSNGLSAISGTFATGTTPVNVRVHPNGKVLYVANFGSGNVTVFAIGDSGALTAVTGSPFAAGTSPAYVATDSEGKFLFVANRGSNNVSVFGIGKDGGLEAVSGSPFAANTVGAPSGLISIN